MGPLRSLAVAIAALCATCAPVAHAAVYSTATGANAAAITPTVAKFRTDLGTLNPNTAGSAASGRREINWDGVPDASAAPNTLSPSFFNSTSPRGVVLSTPGTGFEVSANASAPPVEFSNINATYSSVFAPFSAQRLFTALGSNTTDVTFFVPGAATPATTSGFGVVFTDVDVAGSSSLELFDAGGASLGRVEAPANPGSESLSFAGVLLSGSERASRARIVSGAAALGANDLSPNDMVVMDDFVYGEPQALGTVSTADPAAVAESAGAATVTVTRTSGVGGASAAFATANGTATAGTDFVATSGRVDFAPGETSRTIQVPLLTDAVAESAESFSVALSDVRGAGQLGAPASATVTISDVPPSTGVASQPIGTASPAKDTVAPRVTLDLGTDSPVRAGRFAKGIRALAGSSEDGSCAGRLRAGSKTLLTLKSRACRAGTTRITLKLKGAALTRARRASKLVLELTVTDTAGNKTLRRLTIRLKR